MDFVGGGAGGVEDGGGEVAEGQGVRGVEFGSGEGAGGEFGQLAQGAGAQMWLQEFGSGGAEQVGEEVDQARVVGAGTEDGDAAGANEGE